MKAKVMKEYKPGKGGKKLLVNLLITLVVGLILFYFQLPAINLQSEEFYGFFFILAAVYCMCAIMTSGIYKTQEKGDFFKSVKSHCFLPLAVCAILIAVFIIGGLSSAVMLRAKSYAQLLVPETGDFAADVKEISFDRIPMLDADSAVRLGDRKLGELSDVVSQFEVSPRYSQINYRGVPVRVAQLEYGDFFKWMNNRSGGLPGYVVIDMVTQNVEVVRLTEGMKYSDSEYFFRNIYRYLRFNYPTFMFDTLNFEIDEQGVPYWICPRIVKTVGLFGGTDIKGAVLVNAVTGESSYYEDVPTWVDRVYSADLLIQQYDWHGMYGNGFWNSMFGQRGVTVTTAGYNYIALNDDVYIYTGVTSVGGDESNVGFILVNQRTKQSRFYSCAGAEEYSAMISAEGIVQHLGYRATFPLLLNVSGEPTYFIPLKDNAGLVKMFSMVNVQQYNIVATGATVAACESEYHRLLLQNGVIDKPVTPENSISGVVTDIRTAVIDGNSQYYFKLEGQGYFYAINASNCETAVIVAIGDTVEITGAADSGALRPAALIHIK